MLTVVCWVSYAECHMLSVVKLSVICMLSVLCWVSYAKCRMLSVVMLSVCIQSLTLVPILAYKRNKYTFYNCVYKDESFLSIRKIFFIIAGLQLIVYWAPVWTHLKINLMFPFNSFSIKPHIANSLEAWVDIQKVQSNFIH